MILFFSSTQISSIDDSWIDIPKEETALLISWILYSDLPLVDPKVRVTFFLFPKVLAINVGEIHKETIGFSLLIQWLITCCTSSKTVESTPLNAQSLKFFAAPKPPTRTRELICE